MAGTFKNGYRYISELMIFEGGGFYGSMLKIEIV
jgi:hypothetical protein